MSSKTVIPVKVALNYLGLGSHATARDLWEHKLPPASAVLSADVGNTALFFLKLH